MEEEHKFAYYHEKQTQQCCAVHAVNNLLQGKVFTKDQFDEISNDLQSLDKRSHSSMWGIGNYDVNVVIEGNSDIIDLI